MSGGRAEFTTLNAGWGDVGGSLSSESLVVGDGTGLVCSWGIDDTAHTVLAVLAGGTVVPDGVGIVDGDGEDSGGHARGDLDRAGEEGGGRERAARSIEGGAGDAMGLGPEVELDLGLC